MRAFTFASILAFLLALVITGLYRPKPLEAQLLHLQVEQALPAYADDLSTEPAELQALFLMYADDPVLTAKARLALLRYPESARAILGAYGDLDVFQEVLRRYGEDIILPIRYFRENEILTLQLMRSMNDTARAAWEALRGLWPGESASEATPRAELTKDERGRYAIHFIEREGYDLIGQFVSTPNGEVAWVQTERVLEAINQFFASGIKGLETKWRREEPIGVGDVGWAAVDVAIGVSAFKLLRAGRAGVAGGRALTFSERSAALGAGLWRGTVVGARIVKYGAPAVLAYMAVRHPSVINSLLGVAAEARRRSPCAGGRLDVGALAHHAGATVSDCALGMAIRGAGAFAQMGASVFIGCVMRE